MLPVGELMGVVLQSGASQEEGLTILFGIAMLFGLVWVGKWVMKMIEGIVAFAMMIILILVLVSGAAVLLGI